MSTRHHVILTLAVLCGSAVAQTETEESEVAHFARVILKETNTQGGLVVLLNCGSPSARELIHALWPNDSFLVQALDDSADNVDRIRKAIRARGSYGPVSVSRLHEDQLPYTDNLVRLIPDRWQ